MSRRRIPSALASILALAVLAPAAGAQRIPIRNAAELPRHTYPVPGSASALLEDDAAFAAFAERLAADLHADLAKYEIADRATLRRYYDALLSLALLDGRYGVAVAYADSIRDIEDKPGPRAMAGTLERALAAGLRAPEGERERVFEETFRTELRAVPWEVAQAELKSMKGRMQIISPGMIVGSVQAQLDPAARSGEISREFAARLLNSRLYLDVMHPYQDEALKVLEEIVAAHDVAKADIWAARDVSLEGREGLAPVVIGIWDTGTDVSLFPGQLFVNEREVADNGVDDDGNGYVDDVHGIAYDLHAVRTTGDLVELTYGPDEEAKYRGYLRGFMDLRAGLDTRAAADLRAVMAKLTPGQYTPLFEAITQYSGYSHGTHVAGIAAAGNPAARILVARFTIDHRMIPDLPTEELARAFAKAAGEYVGYFRTHGVRVVNMSWGFAPEHEERALELHNAGGTPEQRKALARKLYDIGANALREALRSAPEVLFVAAAGNADSDNRFQDFAPASFDLPNLVTAAAVDRAGDEAAFTSYGKVEVYANGYEVESFLPGGERSPLSGTSMAAPQVVNLAGKLLAVYPGLTTAQLREAILSGAEEKQIGEGKRIRLLHPARSFEIAERLAGAAARD